jgi:hypothetical protein
MCEKCEPGKVFKNWAEFKEAHKESVLLFIKRTIDET